MVEKWLPFSLVENPRRLVVHGYVQKYEICPGCTYMPPYRHKLQAGMHRSERQPQISPREPCLELREVADIRLPHHVSGSAVVGSGCPKESQPEPVVLSPEIFRSPRKPAPAARSMLAPFRSELSPLLASSPGHLQVKTDAAGHIDKEDPLWCQRTRTKVTFFCPSRASGSGGHDHGQRHLSRNATPKAWAVSFPATRPMRSVQVPGDDEGFPDGANSGLRQGK
ncbi:predicted protein [Chaetomium globosum CBS 148.51]|uniref:Uncharacterized protein n=1 Tax=Chaetomium globosum (strain ATCC 6205 / CBS 148.51 / DSM 1962 / NBRC 6347 / NRRL 1970) TaxID=306901 RepID=Q2GXZ2_CHAGB|nr:uncharacterized protein CHGG_07162 [Chaetomium globosum CBS 148.51]EAQ85909.1 predicted protein [Chaetomium globosum CBS 148.51]